jgi:hypothetical protein
MEERDNIERFLVFSAYESNRSIKNVHGNMVPTKRNILPAVLGAP